MSMLCALGQHQALLAVQSQLLPNERLMAFHDDVHAVSEPERTCKLHNILRQDLWIAAASKSTRRKRKFGIAVAMSPQITTCCSQQLAVRILRHRFGFGEIQVPAALRGRICAGTAPGHRGVP